MQELIFRAIFAIFVALLYAVRLYMKKYPHCTKHGASFEVSVAIATRLWALSLAAYLCGFSWPQLALPGVVRWAGLACFGLCLPASWWTHRALGKYFLTGLALREDHKLVKSGPYRFVRHPMYAVLFASVVAACLATTSMIVIAVGAFLVAVMARRIKREEALLLAYFGREYVEYARKTGAVFPKFRVF